MQLAWAWIRQLGHRTMDMYEASGMGIDQAARPLDMYKAAGMGIDKAAWTQDIGHIHISHLAVG